MKSIEWVTSVLKTTPARWLSLAETLPVELTQQQPLPGEWSALECLRHLVDAEQVFQERVEAFLDGRDFAAFDPDTQGSKSGDRTLAETAGEFARLRAISLALLTNIQPSDLNRQVCHQELGPVLFNELLHEWAAHDLMHTVQAERALMQPFVRSCGPWQAYFEDHLAGAEE